MSYILTNGCQCALIHKDRSIHKTSNISDATKFSTREGAALELNRATRKLKNFCIVEVEDELSEQAANDNGFIKCKRRTFNQSERIAVYNKNKGRCVICGEFVPFDEFTIDHIIPLAKGGSNELSNLQCACKVCNAIKQDILPQDLMDKLSEIILFQTRKTADFTLAEKLTFVKRKYRRKKFARTIGALLK